MRILVVTPYLPHSAASHGGGVYLDAFLTELCAEAEVALLSFTSLAEADMRPELCPGLAAVHRIPHPLRRELDGIARRRHQARMLLHWGLRGLPIDAAKFASQTMKNLLPQVASQFGADIVVFEFRQMAQYLPCLPDLPRVFCDHEAGDPPPVDFGAARDRRLTAAYLRRFYPQADLIQALNQVDAERLAERTGCPVEVRQATVTLPPHPVDPGATPPVALFLGDYRHHPNPEAAGFLVHQVWPAVRRRVPDAELWLAGPNATPAVEALAQDDVRVLGFVPDLARLLGSVRTLVTPLFSGSGSRIKVLTALAHGLPVIGNDLAFRGIDAGDVVLRGENAEAIAGHTTDLLTSAERTTTRGRQSRHWAEQHLDPRSLAVQQVARYAELIAAHRGR